MDIRSQYMAQVFTELVEYDSALALKWLRKRRPDDWREIRDWASGANEVPHEVRKAAMYRAEWLYLVNVFSNNDDPRYISAITQLVDRLAKAEDELQHYMRSTGAEGVDIRLGSGVTG